MDGGRGVVPFWGLGKNIALSSPTRISLPAFLFFGDEVPSLRKIHFRVTLKLGTYFGTKAPFQSWFCYFKSSLLRIHTNHGNEHLKDTVIWGGNFPLRGCVKLDRAARGGRGRDSRNLLRKKYALLNTLPCKLEDQFETICDCGEQD